MITKVMITTPSDTPIRPHHRRCARATSTWPLTRVAGLTCRCEIGLGLAEVAGTAGGLEVFPSRKASAAARHEHQRYPIGVTSCSARRGACRPGELGVPSRPGRLRSCARACTALRLLLLWASAALSARR